MFKEVATPSEAADHGTHFGIITRLQPDFIPRDAVFCSVNSRPVLVGCADAGRDKAGTNCPATHKETSANVKAVVCVPCWVKRNSAGRRK